MRVCLVYPVHLTLSREIAEDSLIHRGLCALSASLKAKGVEDVSLLDLRRIGSVEEFETKLKRADPDYLCLTCNSIERDTISTVLSSSREVCPKCRTIVGGPDTVVALDLYREDPRVDYIVVGEGDLTLPELVLNSPDEKVHIGQRADLNSLPMPDYELFDLSKELQLEMIPGMKIPSLGIMVSRGCPFNCTFCQPTEELLFGRPRLMTVEKAVSEVKVLLKRHHLRSITFLDDCLLSYPTWIEAFSNALLREQIDLQWALQGRTNSTGLNGKTLALAKEAGLYCIMFGAESGSDRVLTFINKGTKVDDSYTAKKLCDRHNIKFWMNIVLGFPTETEAEMLETKMLIETLEPFHVSPNIYAPVPGTYLHTYCKELGLLEEEGSLRRDLYAESVRGINYDLARAIYRFALKYSGKRFRKSKWDWWRR